MVVDDEHLRAHARMLAGPFAIRIVASPNRSRSKSRSSTESGVVPAPFSYAQPIPSLVVLMPIDQGGHMRPIEEAATAIGRGSDRGARAGPTGEGPS